MRSRLVRIFVDVCCHEVLRLTAAGTAVAAAVVVRDSGRGRVVGWGERRGERE